VFCEGVQHRLPFCFARLNCAKMAAFQIYLQSGKQKSRVDGGRQSCCLWSKIPWWKRKWETVRCRDAIPSSFVAKVRGEVFERFYAVAVKRHNSTSNWLFGLPERILVNHWCRGKWWACSFTLLLTYHAFFGLCEFGHSVYSSWFLPQMLV
jgi:hypothetical protein